MFIAPAILGRLSRVYSARDSRAFRELKPRQLSKSWVSKTLYNYAIPVYNNYVDFGFNLITLNYIFQCKVKDKM